MQKLQHRPMRIYEGNIYIYILNPIKDNPIKYLQLLQVIY